MFELLENICVQFWLIMKEKYILNVFSMSRSKQVMLENFCTQYFVCTFFLFSKLERKFNS